MTHHEACVGLVSPEAAGSILSHGRDKHKMLTFDWLSKLLLELITLFYPMHLFGQNAFAVRKHQWEELGEE